MGTAERRLEILKYLCKVRKATMPHLAETFGVSVRTIKRDILELESIFHIPIEIKSGKYNGGIYLTNDYSFDRMYMHNDEIKLMQKVHRLVKNELNTEENLIFENIIKKYSIKF